MKTLDNRTARLIHLTIESLVELAYHVRKYDDDCSNECFLVAMELRDLLDREDDYEEEEIIPVLKHTSRVKVRKIRKGGN